MGAPCVHAEEEKSGGSNLYNTNPTHLSKQDSGRSWVGNSREEQLLALREKSDHRALVC